MRNVMICTVGTSLRANLSKAENTLLPELLKNTNIQGLALELSKIDPADRTASDAKPKTR